MTLEDKVLAANPLEERTIAALRAKGLVGSRQWLPHIALVAVALLFLAAVATSLWPIDGSRPSPVQTGRTYLMALYTGPDYRPSAPFDPSRAEEYGRWASAHQDGDAVVIGGEELGGTAAVFGVPSRPGDELAGYFLIRAESEADALKLAASTPHVRHGGTVVVREIVQHEAPSGD